MNFRNGQCYVMILSFEKHRVRIMFEITRVEPQIIEIRHSGAFRIEQAKEYQHLMTAMLSQGSGLLDVLGNFKNTTSFEKPVLRELGLFSFLTDQRLGMLVLIGDDPLTKFVSPSPNFRRVRTIATSVCAFTMTTIRRSTCCAPRSSPQSGEPNRQLGWCHSRRTRHHHTHQNRPASWNCSGRGTSIKIR